MARAIWKGHISFGLVNVPVNLHSAERRSELSFHLLDSRDRARVRYQRVNEATGEEVPWDQIVKGYEYGDGSYVVIGDEDLRRAAPEATQAVEIEGFVDREDIDLLYFDKPYYLSPDKKGEKGYVLLREVLERTGKVGIARVVIRTRQYVAALLPRQEALVLNLLRYHEELRATEDLDLPAGSAAEHKISDKEIKMAEQLVAAMTEDWEPERYHDEYREKLMAWIDRKIEAGDLAEAPEAEELEEAPATYNIMDLLKRSVEESGGTKKKTSKKTKKKTVSGSKKKTTRKKAG